jgi:5-methylcytosine-specific restriction endonuclease McrA
MPRGDEWNTNNRRRRKAREHLAARTTFPTPCASHTSPNCTDLVNLTDDWIVGHIHSRLEHPELMWEPTNHRIECRHCSNYTGGQTRQAQRRAQKGPQSPATTPPGTRSPTSPVSSTTAALRRARNG